jgi:hypothetical protein
MSSYWIYQSRFAQTADTLDAVAAGDWPLYSGQDPVPAKPRKASR